MINIIVDFFVICYSKKGSYKNLEIFVINVIVFFDNDLKFGFIIFLMVSVDKLLSFDERVLYKIKCV